MALTCTFFIASAVTILCSFFQYYSASSLNQLQNVIEAWVNNVTLQNGTLVTSFSFITTSFSIGSVFAALFIFMVAEKLGRRNGLIFSGIIAVIGGACELVSKQLDSLALLIAGRVILGVNFGLAIPFAALYLMEISPEETIGKVMGVALIVANFCEGPFVFLGLPNLLGTEELWPVVVGLPMVPGLCLCLGLMFCPQSPFYLRLIKHDRNAAEKAAEKLMTGRDLQILMKRLEKEEIDHEIEIHQPHTVKHIIHSMKSMGSRICLALTVVSASYFTGLLILLSYSTNIFRSFGLTEQDSHYATVVLCFCYFLGSLPGPFIIDKVGRRRLFLLSVTSSIFCWAIVFTLLSLPPHLKPDWLGYFNVAICCVLVFLFGLACSVPKLLINELFIHKHRSLAAGLCYLYENVLSTCLVAVFPELEKITGLNYSLLPLIVLSAICLVVLWLWLPETGILEEDLAEAEEPIPISIVPRKSVVDIDMIP